MPLVCAEELKLLLVISGMRILNFLFGLVLTVYLCCALGLPLGCCISCKIQLLLISKREAKVELQL